MKNNNLKTHGGYRNLKSYQTTTLVYDLTVEFCKIYMTYETNKSYLSNPEDFANCLICLIHQANYLLDQQLASLEKAFIEEGGYTEALFKKRLERRQR